MDQTGSLQYKTSDSDNADLDPGGGRSDVLQDEYRSSSSTGSDLEPTITRQFLDEELFLYSLPTEYGLEDPARSEFYSPISLFDNSRFLPDYEPKSRAEEVIQYDASSVWYDPNGSDSNSVTNGGLERITLLTAKPDENLFASDSDRFTSNSRNADLEILTNPESLISNYNSKQLESILELPEFVDTHHNSVIETKLTDFGSHDKLFSKKIISYQGLGTQSHVANDKFNNFIHVDSSEVIHKFDKGLDNTFIHEIFQKAKLSSPCIVFFDKFEMVATKDPILAQILKELDKVDSVDVKVLAATNKPRLIEPILLRLGGIDKLHLIDMPNSESSEKFSVTSVKSEINYARIIQDYITTLNSRVSRRTVMSG